MSDEPKYDPAAPRPDGYDEFKEREQTTEIPVPNGIRPPDQLCIINLEVQFLNDEDPEPPGERKAFIRALAEEIHDRLMKIGKGWQRHSISYRSLEAIEKVAEVEETAVRSAIDEAEEAGIAKKPTLLH